MDHAVDLSVLEATDPSGAAGLGPHELAAIVSWIDGFSSDRNRKLVLDLASVIWSKYYQLGADTYGLLALQRKWDQASVRFEPVKQTVDGEVILGGDWKHLDEARRWIAGVAERRADISVANGTYLGWHESKHPPGCDKIYIHHILEERLDAQLEAEALAHNTDSQQHYHLPPKSLSGKLAEAKSVGVGTNGRHAWEDSKFRYEFDRQHNTVEVYSLGNGKWVCEASLDGTTTKTDGGKGRSWGKN
jgi:hypothetical protein